VQVLRLLHPLFLGAPASDPRPSKANLQEHWIQDYAPPCETSGLDFEIFGSSLFSMGKAKIASFGGEETPIKNTR
jgi:hypothetical protein